MLDEDDDDEFQIITTQKQKMKKAMKQNETKQTESLALGLIYCRSLTGQDAIKTGIRYKQNVIKAFLKEIASITSEVITLTLS